MRVLICHDDGQLRRVESAIAAIESASPGYHQGKMALLAALRLERASLLQHARRATVTAGQAAMPAPKHLKWLNAPIRMAVA